MKLIAGTLLLLSFASIAHANDDDGFDTKKALAGKAWLMPLLEEGATVAAPSKDKPFDYTITATSKKCKALEQGTARDEKTFTKLRTCLLATYKADGASEAQWIEYRPKQLADIVSMFPKKYAKAIKAQMKDSTVVEGHFTGNGVNMDVYLALDANDRPHALWILEDEFE